MNCDVGGDKSLTLYGFKGKKVQKIDQICKFDTAFALLLIKFAE